MLNLDFEITDEIMEKINVFARQPLQAEKVYCFGCILCDNEIDRDHERFSLDSLEKLATLFVGKTGITDHNPKAENQQARIFDCYVHTDDTQKTSDGQSYSCLVGRAYMVRTPENQSLIAEIDGGIKKEVSVSCTVEKNICSVCGADLSKSYCPHIKGKTYEDKQCFVTLENPLDAYEWSFVAVPAQVNAGVHKGYRDNSDSTDHDLEKNRLLDENYVLRKALESEVGSLLHINGGDFTASQQIVGVMPTKELIELKTKLKSQLKGKSTSQLENAIKTNDSFKLK